MSSRSSLLDVLSGKAAATRLRHINNFHGPIQSRFRYKTSHLGLVRKFWTCIHCDPNAQLPLLPKTCKTHSASKGHQQIIQAHQNRLHPPLHTPQGPSAPAPPPFLSTTGHPMEVDEDPSPLFDVPLSESQPNAIEYEFRKMREEQARVDDLGLDPEDLAENWEEGEDDEDLNELLDGFESVSLGNWEPFENKGEWLTHLITNIPRFSFSRPTIKLILRWAELMGAKEVPKYDALRNVKKKLRLATSTPAPTRHEGCNGHIFYTLPISSGVARDFANPSTRAEMQLYPRRGEGLYEIYDGAHISKNLDASVTTPMCLSPSGKTAFAFEPLQLHDSSLVWPTHWFEEHGQLRGQGFKIRHTNSRLEIDRDSVHCFAVTDIAATAPELSVRPGFQNITIIDSGLPNSPIHPFLSTDRSLSHSEPFYSTPYMIFLDDAKGDISNKWNKHWMIYGTNASIPRKLQELEANTRFLATSNIADALEMCEAYVKELNAILEKPLRVWDCKTRSFVFIRIYLVVIIGDNPMMAELASCMQHSANFNCRICKFGGDTKFRATPAGFTAALQPGEPRTIDFLKSNIERSISLAEVDSMTALQNVSKETGVKDALAEEVITILLEHHDDLKRVKTPRNELATEMAELRASLLETTYMNPLIDLKGGFDITSCTPPGILHLFALGLVKYSWNRTLGDLKGDKKAALKAQIICWLEQASTDGLPAGQTLNAEYFVEHRDSLVGKELRLLSQVGALAFVPLVRDGFMPAEMLDIWRAIGDLGGLLYVQGIPQARIEDYTLNLKYAIRNILLAWAKVAPSIIQSRPKFHVTTHLDEAAALFSVPQCFNEERYEHKHSIARDASMKSNRQRPSFDIATRLADQEMTAHLMSAGYYTTPAGLVRQASPELRGLLGSPALSLFRQKYGLEFMETSRTPGALF
ncbi:hypothetical protein P7C70_g2640, partial [Phenoliferia sp. Uapishka_3]